MHKPVSPSAILSLSSSLPVLPVLGCIPEEQGSKQAVDAILGVSDPVRRQFSER